MKALGSRFRAVLKRRSLLIAGAIFASCLAAFAAWHTFWRTPTDDRDVFVVRAVPPSTGDGFGLALYQSLGVSMTTGHRLVLLQNGNVFDGIVGAIGAAQSSVHIGMYIWERGAASDRVVSALVARAEAGVLCLVLVDDVGSPDFGEQVAPRLRKAGCDVRVFRPLTGNKKIARSHRKLVIVDGNVALTGGFGIRDSWLGDGVHAESWRDTNVSFTGPAVSGAQQAFAENWQEAGGPLLPAQAFPASAPSDPIRAAFVASSSSTVTRAERLMQLMIAAATRRLWIANAYFVPSRGILRLIEQKARSGVDVRLLAPYKNSDSKTAFGAQHIEYGDLAKQGVKIWEYTPSMMHAKTMIVDEELGLVGSINLDPLSLNELEEDALVVQDRGFTDQLAQSFVGDCSRSKRYEP